MSSEALSLNYVRSSLMPYVTFVVLFKSFASSNHTLIYTEGIGARVSTSPRKIHYV